MYPRTVKRKEFVHVPRKRKGGHRTVNIIHVDIHGWKNMNIFYVDIEI